MDLTTSQWHERYLQQSKWTAELREFIFNQIGFKGAGTVLEVGCGTGAVLSSLPGNPSIFGLDIQYPTLGFAKSKRQQTGLICGNAFTIPLADTSFDVTFCHYLFLWLKSPLNALREMKRVTKRGGFVVAFAEPDHAGRIDYPSELRELGALQSQSLAKQGVNLMSGRQISELFFLAGFTEIVSGVMAFQKPGAGLPDWFESEWQMLERDLGGSIAATRLADYKAADEHAWMEGSRILWVPTFYAFGRV